MAAANGSKSAAEKPARRLRIPLSLKFAAVTVILVALLLAAGSAVSLWSGYNTAQRSALALQQAKAEALADRIGGVMAELESQLAWTAQPSWKTADSEQQRADFRRMLAQFPAVTELIHIDRQGAEQLKVSRLAPDSVASLTSHANEPRFTETVKAKTWFGPVYVRNGAELAGTVGVAHGDGGATIAELDLAFLTAPVKAATADGAEVFVIDGAGRLIAHPSRNPVAGDNDLSALPQVAAALAAKGSGTSTEAVTESGAVPAFAAWAQAPGVGWTAIVQTPAAAAMAPFHTLLWQTGLLVAAGLLAATLVGVWLARRVAAPIKRLQASTELLGEGDLTQRVAVRRRDEIGALADKFNAMANRLQQSQKGLEAKIDDSAVGFDVALQQQSITADMLKTISRTDYDLERVLDTLIGSAVRLSEANVGAVWLRDGDAFRLAAQLGHTNDWAEAARKAPFTRETDLHAVAAAAAYSGQVINVDDTSRDLRFMGEYGERPANSDERAALAVPLKHGDRVEAVFSLSRADPLPFLERQVSVVQDFADQALIAIRNVRLTETIDARSRALAGTAEELAATGGILHAIAQAPTDVQPVLDTIVESAARLAKARYCHVALFDGTLLKVRAHRGLPPEAAGLIGVAAAPSAGSPADQATTACKAVLFADLQAEPEQVSDELARLLGVRSVAVVPLLKGDAAIGVMTVADPEPNALPETRLALLKTLADQAVIALDGARVHEEARLRTSERDTSLQQLFERTAERDEWRQRHAADLEAAGRQHAAEMDEASRQHAVEVEEARQRFEAAAEKHSAEMEEARSQHAAEVDEARQRFDVAAEKHAAETDEASRQHAVEVEEARQRFEAAAQKHAAEMEEANRLHASEVEEARQRFDVAAEKHAAETDETSRLHAAEVKEARQRFDAAAEKHAAEMEEASRLHAAVVEEARQRFDAAAEQHAAEMDEARSLHAAQVDEARRQFDAAAEQHAAEMEETRRLHAAEVDETSQRHAAELDEARRRHAEELDDRQGAHAEELGETIKRHGAALDEAQHLYAAEIGEARRLHAEELDQALRLHADEREQARLQRTAAAEALKRVAEPSPGLQTVLESVLGSAARACGAGAGVLFRQEGNGIEVDAAFGLTEENREPTLRTLRDTLAAEVLTQGGTLHIADLSSTTGYVGEAAFHAALGVPLMRNGTAQGALALLRTDAKPFGEEAAELAEGFADQASIAIEMERRAGLAAKRAGELDERSRSLARAQRERETTARMLAVMGRTQIDLGAVLGTLARSAAELCDAGMAAICLGDAVALESAGSAGFPDGWLSDAGHHQTADLARRAARGSEPLQSSGDAEAGSALAVPLAGPEGAIGALVIVRQAPFGDAELAVATTLADQAAMAVGNVRLREALETRTAEFGEALRQQAAAADLLRSANDAGFDLGDMLSAMAGQAARLCGGASVRIYLGNDDALRFAAGAALTAEQRAYEEANPQRAGANSDVGRAATGTAVVHLAGDGVTADQARFGDTAAMLCVPMVREGATLGVLALARQEPRPFSEREIELVRIFADQAAIAAGNVRLLDEAKARAAEFGEALRQQAATAEVLKAISRPAFELGGVLTTLTASAASFCNAGGAAIYLEKDGAFRVAAATGAMPEPLVRAQPASRDSWIGAAALDRSMLHVANAAGNTEHPEIAKISGLGAILCVPLLHDGAATGVFALTRTEPGPFTASQIELMRTFADQAVIAIEGARRSGEAQARAQEIAALLQDLHAAQARLTESERLASLAELTAGIGHDVEGRLRAVNEESLRSNKLVDDIRMVLEAAVIDGGTRAEVEELGDALKANLDKVVWEGKRAEAVVRNTLLQSHEGPGEHRRVDINAVLDESLGVAFHGARAERQDFDITLEKTLDPKAGAVDLYPQEITRVLINLISNGFHATRQRSAQANGFYRPVLAASTKDLGDAVEVRIRDNGTGISTEVKERMFDPFFTTKPAGQASGLGLSLGRDIVVKQHGGTMEVETAPGSFTEFRIVLPRRAAPAENQTEIRADGGDAAQSS